MAVSNAISAPLVLLDIPKRRRRGGPIAVRLECFGLEEDGRKQWDNFYLRHQNKFFKDRHYLEKDWGQYFSPHPPAAAAADDDDDNTTTNPPPKIILEAGCGAGNTIFPLAKKYPHLYVHACDFSTHAITLVKSHPNFLKDQVNVFVCNIAEENLCDHVMPASVDIVTLVFTLSAVSPEKMPVVIQNLALVLKPNGHVLFRDYAIGDYAQCSFYFSEDMLSKLFERAGFVVVDVNTYNREIINRARGITMQRRWIRAVFRRP